jgi:hypothetical protein
MAYQAFVEQLQFQYPRRAHMDANQNQTTETKDTVIPTDGAPAPATGDDAGEFKIEIRKLEVPVRPRGVLAE